jgi:hypothetical protein
MTKGHTIHQAGSLKQTNKAHKHGFRSKRAIDNENKGKLRNLKVKSL